MRRKREGSRHWEAGEKVSLQLQKKKKKKKKQKKKGKESGVLTADVGLSILTLACIRGKEKRERKEEAAY